MYKIILYYINILWKKDIYDINVVYILRIIENLSYNSRNIHNCSNLIDCEHCNNSQNSQQNDDFAFFAIYDRFSEATYIRHFYKTYIGRFYKDLELSDYLKGFFKVLGKYLTFKNRDDLNNLFILERSIGLLEDIGLKKDLINNNRILL